MTEEHAQDLRRGVVASDLTERTQGAEPPLWPRTQDCLAAAFGKVAVWHMDLASGRFETDGSLERIIGYAPGEIGTEPAEWRRVTHPDDLERTTLAWQQVSAGVTDRYDCEYRLLHKDGSVRWVDVCGSGQKDDAGLVVRVAGTTVDITERKRAEEAFREIEAVKRQALECSPDAVFAIDREYRLLFNNERHHQVLADSGTTPFQVGETVLSPAYPPDMLATWRAAYDRALHGEAFDWETGWTDVAGCSRVYENSLSPLRNTSNTILGALIVAREITERKQVESALRASEARYRGVVEDQTEVISRIKSDGTLLFVNEVYCRFFGKTAVELVGNRWQPIAVADDVPHIEKQLQTICPTNPVVLIENRVYAGDGQMHWMQFVNRGFFDEQGRLAEIQSVGRDITERKRVQEEMDQLRSQLWHLERVGRSGVIAASLAHELNQPLMGILSTAQAGLRFLAAGNLDSQRIGEILANIARDAQRAGAVINGVRTLLGRAESQRQPTGLAEVTREVLDLLSGEFASRRIECHLRSDVDAVVRANKAQIQQVLLNLVTNGLDAVADEPPERRRVELTLGRADPGQAKVTVRDFGPGIAPEQRATLFRPFATTKVHGLGIGLAISFTIVEAHGGRLWYEEPPDRGAILCFTLPLDASDEAVADSQSNTGTR